MMNMYSFVQYKEYCVNILKLFVLHVGILHNCTPYFTLHICINVLQRLYTTLLHYIRISYFYIFVLYFSIMFLNYDYTVYCVINM